MAEYINAKPLKKEIADLKRTIHSENTDYQTGYMSALSVVEGMIAEQTTANVIPEESILKFFYCKSEDDYYLGLRVDNFYYAKYDKCCGRFVWCMSRYLPWGERVADEDTLWKEHNYPSEPIEIGFEEWLKGFIDKHIVTDTKFEKYGYWCTQYRGGTPVAKGVVSSCCDMWNERKTAFCPHCGTKMKGED